MSIANLFRPSAPRRLERSGREIRFVPKITTGRRSETTTDLNLAGTMQLAFQSPVKTKALKGGAACPQAAADGSVVRQPPGDRRLHPYCIVPA
jgi:hypothetical protein